MTNLQKLTLRQSEIRKRLNEISGLSDEDFTDKVKEEFDNLKTELADVEVRYQAALLAGDGETEKVNESTGEGTEIRNLLDKASISSYLKAAADGNAINTSSVEGELNSALEVRGQGVVIPFEMLEMRVDAPTTTTQLDGGTSQRPILQRLFGKDIFDFLGVRIDSVPVGMTEWPLLSGGGAVPGMVSESSSAGDAVASTFETQTLKPKRLTAKYLFSVEMANQVKDLESVLRRDLMSSIKNQMCSMLLSGDGTSPNITGFYNRLSAQAPAPTNVAEYAHFVKAPAEVIDGIHASMLSEVSMLLGVEAYQLACGLFNEGNGESAAETLTRQTRGLMASSYIPAKVTHVINGNLLHAGGDVSRGDSIAAMWSGGVSLVRDIYSGAAEGQVSLVWVTLWDCYTAFRQSAYKRVSFKVSS